MSRLLRILQSELSARTVLAIADQFVISGTRFVATWMIARFCGAEQLGYYALGFSGLVLIDLVLQAFVTAPFTIFSQGLSTNRLSRYTGDGLVQSSFIGSFGSIVFAVIGCVAAQGDSRMLAGVMYMVAVVIPICVLREFARRQCFATERIGLALGIDIFFSMVQLGLMYVLLEMQCLAAVSAHAVTGLACGLSLLIWFIVRRDCIVFSTRYLILRATKHWRFGRWVFVSQAMNQLTWNVVQWVIAFRLSAEATGVFTGCLTIAFLSNPFVLGIAGVIYPRLALLKNNDGSRAMRRLVWFATVAIGGVMTSFTLVLLTAGQEVCCFLFTDTAYANVGLLPGILAAAVSCLAITMPMDGALWAENRTDLSSASSGIGLGVTTVAVAVLVPWGVTAAAMGLLLGCVFEVGARIVFFIRCHACDSRESNSLVCSR